MAWAPIPIVGRKRSENVSKTEKKRSGCPVGQLRERKRRINVQGREPKTEKKRRRKRKKNVGTHTTKTEKKNGKKNGKKTERKRKNENEELTLTTFPGSTKAGTALLAPDG